MQQRGSDLLEGEVAFSRVQQRCILSKDAPLLSFLSVYMACGRHPVVVGPPGVENIILNSCRSIC